MSNLSYLSEYSPFDSTQELNEAVDEHLHMNKHELNETDRDVLLMLAQYSVKYHGVAHLKADTIARTVSKSKRTIQRSIRKLERLHIIKRKPFLRRITGGNGANIYVFMSSNDTAELSGREQADKPTCTSDQVDDSTNEPINSISESNTDDSVDEQVIHDSIRNNTPPVLVDMLAPYFYGTSLYKYVGIVFKAKYHPHVQTLIESHTDAFKACISDVIRRWKGGQVRSLEGYLYTSIKALTRRLYLT